MQICSAKIIAETDKFFYKKYVSRETLGRNTCEKMVQYFIEVRSNLWLLRKGHEHGKNYCSCKSEGRCR